MPNKLVSTKEMARLLGVSEHTIRDYKERRLLRIAAKDGNHDKYDPIDTKRRWAQIQQLRTDGFNLQQIAQKLESK